MIVSGYSQIHHPYKIRGVIGETNGLSLIETLLSCYNDFDNLVGYDG